MGRHSTGSTKGFGGLVRESIKSVRKFLKSPTKKDASTKETVNSDDPDYIMNIQEIFNKMTTQEQDVFMRKLFNLSTTNDEYDDGISDPRAEQERDEIMSILYSASSSLYSTNSSVRGSRDSLFSTNSSNTETSPIGDRDYTPEILGTSDA